jgi:hypothetical protein
VSNEIGPTGISGKKLTRWIIGLMILVGAAIAYLLNLYDRVEDIRLSAARNWREVAATLDPQYRQIEAALDTPPVELDSNWIQEFRRQADQFRTATNTESQCEHALKLENALNQHPALRVNREQISPQLASQIAAYNQDVLAENKLRKSIGGKILFTLMPFPQRQVWPEGM